MIFSGDIIGGFKAIWDGIKNLIMVPINFVVDTVNEYLWWSIFIFSWRHLMHLKMQ
jgi:hypothetical protein